MCMGQLACKSASTRIKFNVQHTMQYTRTQTPHAHYAKCA